MLGRGPCLHPWAQCLGHPSSASLWSGQSRGVSESGKAPPEVPDSNTTRDTSHCFSLPGHHVLRKFVYHMALTLTLTLNFKTPGNFCLLRSSRK